MVHIKDIFKGIVAGRERSDIKSLLAEGNNHYEAGEFEKAIQCFDRIIDFNPKCADAYYGKGLSLTKLGLYEEAIKNFDKVLAVHPTLIQVLFQKGNTLAYLARFEEAIEHFDRVIKLNPDFIDAFTNKAICYRRLGEYSKAFLCVKDADMTRGKQYLGYSLLKK